MKTKEQFLKEYKSEALDNRDISRIAQWLTNEELESLGFKRTNSEEFVPLEWTKETMLKQLKEDVEFGFKKALNQRGISASLMSNVIMMWVYILEPDIDVDGERDYPMYGLPILKKVAIHYGFPNPIGDDNGDEDSYNIDEPYIPLFPDYEQD